VKQNEVEKQLFARLATEPKFREYLEDLLQKEYQIFISALDKDYLVKAQGRAGLLQMLIQKLDDARKGS
jgi:hypothetical protein